MACGYGIKVNQLKVNQMPPRFPTRSLRKATARQWVHLGSHSCQVWGQDWNPELIPKFALSSPLPLNTNHTACAPEISTLWGIALCPSRDVRHSKHSTSEPAEHLTCWASCQAGRPQLREAEVLSGVHSLPAAGAAIQSPLDPQLEFSLQLRAQRAHALSPKK